MRSFILLSILIAFLYGIQPLIHKYLLRKFDVIQIMLITELIYILCISYVGFINKHLIINDICNMNAYDVLIIIFVGIVTIFISDMIYYYILKDHDSSIVTAIIYSSIIFTLIISYYFGTEELNCCSYFGIFMILLGVYFITSYHD